MKKIAQIDYFLFAENVFQGEKGKQTVINIYDEIYAVALPTVQMALFLAIKLANMQLEEGSDLNFTIKISAPNGGTIGESSISTGTDKYDSKRHNGFTLGVNASGLPIQEFGNYKFELMLNGQSLGSRELIVKSADEYVERPTY